MAEKSNNMIVVLVMMSARKKVLKGTYPNGAIAMCPRLLTISHLIGLYSHGIKLNMIPNKKMTVRTMVGNFKLDGKTQKNLKTITWHMRHSCQTKSMMMPSDSICRGVTW